MRTTWTGPSARANSRPEPPPPGGRTATQCVPPPSGVFSQSSRSRESDRLIIAHDHEANEGKILIHRSDQAECDKLAFKSRGVTLYQQERVAGCRVIAPRRCNRAH